MGWSRLCGRVNVIFTNLMFSSAYTCNHSSVISCFWENSQGWVNQIKLLDILGKTLLKSQTSNDDTYWLKFSELIDGVVILLWHKKLQGGGKRSFSDLYELLEGDERANRRTSICQSESTHETPQRAQRNWNDLLTCSFYCHQSRVRSYYPDTIKNDIMILRRSFHPRIIPSSRAIPK